MQILRETRVSTRPLMPSPVELTEKTIGTSVRLLRIGLGIHARKVQSLVRAALPVPAGHLRVGAKRPGANSRSRFGGAAGRGRIATIYPEQYLARPNARLPGSHHGPHRTVYLSPLGRRSTGQFLGCSVPSQEP